MKTTDQKLIETIRTEYAPDAMDGETTRAFDRKLAERIERRKSFMAPVWVASVAVVVALVLVSVTRFTLRTEPKVDAPTVDWVSPLLGESYGLGDVDESDESDESDDDWVVVEESLPDDYQIIEWLVATETQGEET